MQCLKSDRQQDRIQPCAKRTYFIVSLCTWISVITLGCAPSSNQLSSEEIAHNLATHIQASPHAKLAQSQNKIRSKLTTANKHVEASHGQGASDLETRSVASSVAHGDFFSASDRM